MEQINKIEIRGRVGNSRIVEVSGKNVCHFSVATNSVFRTTDGQMVEEVTWHNCTLWGSRKYPDLGIVKVGGGIEVKGRMKISRYTGSDGVDRYSYEVIVSECKPLPDDEVLTPIVG